MATGCVFDIQRFSLHDGPGIRTLVFLKGCPLRCVWCSNPESHLEGPELLYDASKCTRCGDCVRVCTTGALTSDPGGVPVCSRALCTLCAACVAACSSAARWICGRWMSTEDVIPIIRRDLSFYRRSGGGATLGGGDPVWQPAFALELLHHLKYAGIDSAVETCGYGRPESVIPLLLSADHVYFDIKHAEPQRHLALTGVTNELILTNLAILLEQHKDVTVRFPLVPEYNDQPHDIDLLATLLLGLPRTPPVEILPYHRYGEHKYRLQQRDYPLAGSELPATHRIAHACRTLQEHGIACRVLVQ